MKLEYVEPGDTKFREWLRRYREEVDGAAPPEDWLDGYVQTLFKDQAKTRHIWYAVDQGRRIGFAIATLHRGMANGRNQGMIAEFFVNPEYRREGYGRRLAQAVIDFLKGAGASDVYAAVVAGNVRGLRFYQACGFRIARYSLVFRPEALEGEEEEEAI